MKKLLASCMFAVFGVIVLASCGGSDKDADIRGEARGGPGGPKTGTGQGNPNAVAYPADKATGSIAGKVTFSGTPPAPVQIAMSDNVCKEAHPTPLMTEEVVVDAKGGLKNVFVYIAPVSLSQYRFSGGTERSIDQKGCAYSPHVSGAMLGDTVYASNSDKTSHNVHTGPVNNTPINLAQGPGARDKVLSADSEEMAIKVKCDVHSWMTSYIHVLPHPKFAVTADDGSFKIEGLVPGKYTLCFWHERYAKDDPKTIEITVEDGKAADGSYVMKK